MEIAKEVWLILGQPFLTIADAQIDMGAGLIHLYINGKEERFKFRPRKEQCSMIKDSPTPNTPAREVEMPKRQVDNLIAFMKNFWKEELQHMSAGQKQYWKSQSQSKRLPPTRHNPHNTQKMWRRVNRKPTSIPKEITAPLPK